MADNVTIDTITGSPVARTDDIGGFHYQVIKIGLGVDGSIDGFVSTTTPMPISDAGGSITVDGTVAVTSAALTSIDGKITACNTGAVVVSSSALPTGAASEASLASLNAKVNAVDTGAVVIASSAAIPVTDGAGSLTVDAPVATPVFVRLSDGSSAIATLPVSLASVPSHAVTNAGTFAVQAAQSGTWNVGTVTTVSAVTAITNALPAGTNLIGDVGLQGRTGNGLTPYRSVDVDETKFQVKGSAGTLQTIHAMNMTAAVLYLHVYDQVSASVTVGTTTPAFTFPLPTNADTNGCGFVCNFGLPGAAFANGITMAVTTTVGGTSGPAANGVFCNGLYK